MKEFFNGARRPSLKRMEDSYMEKVEATNDTEFYRKKFNFINEVKSKNTEFIKKLEEHIIFLHKHKLEYSHYIKFYLEISNDANIEMLLEEL